MTQDLTISIHVPKCAGTSFKKLLTKEYSIGLELDYGDLINNYSDRAIRKRQKNNQQVLGNFDKLSREKSIIHGHFYAEKYLPFKDQVRWITFLRSPYALVPSYYFYLLNKQKGELSELVRDLGSLEAFIAHDWFSNIVTRQLQGLDVTDFAYIGFVEDYENSVKELCSTLNITYRKIHANKGKKTKSEMAQNSAQGKDFNWFGLFPKQIKTPKPPSYQLSMEQRQLIEHHSGADIELYERAKLRFWPNSPKQ